jgi:hypothetical protein
MNAPRDATVLQWPAERFYWAMLEAPGVRCTGQLPPGMLAMLEEHVPISLDELHAVAAAIDDQRVLVCAAVRRELDVAAPGAAALVPSEIPAGLAAGIHPRSLNLLVGEYEPKASRRARFQAHALTAATVLLCAVLVSIGLHRRAEHFRSIADDARTAGDAAIAGTLEDPATAFPLREMHAMRESLTNASAATAPSEAIPALSTLLKAWPADVPSNPQTITAAASELSLSVAVEGDPARFLTNFKPPIGWTMDQPRLNAAGDLTRIVIRLRTLRKEPT